MCGTQYNAELYMNNSLRLKQIIHYYYNLKIINQRDFRKLYIINIIIIYNIDSFRHTMLRKLSYKHTLYENITKIFGIDILIFILNVQSFTQEIMFFNRFKKE